MPTDLMMRGRRALTAWQRGDLSAVAELLDPEVELTWWGADRWSCRGKEAVLALLRERSSAGETGGDVELLQVGEDRLVVSRRPTSRDGGGPGRPATLVTFSAGQVVRMRQFRSLADALAAHS